MFCKTLTRLKFINLYHKQYFNLSNQSVNAFKIINSNVNVNSDIYKKNYDSNIILCEKYSNLLKQCVSGGDAKAIERHTIRNKKLLVDDRLKLLFDQDDDLLEISSTAGIGMRYGDVPRGGIVTAIGRIHGVNCIAIANDATVKAGTVFPITLKKQLRAMEIAHENRLPCIFVVDSGGAFLPLQAEIFQPGGRTFYNEAITNSLDIPQLAIVCGSCTAGAAYVPTMSQEAIIVDKIGTIFLAGPPLVQSALGEIVSPEELGGATMHSSVSGCTDHFASTEEDAFSIGRDSVFAFNLHPVDASAPFSPPLYSAEELIGIIGENTDAYQVIARVVDGSRFHEFKALFGTTVVTGFGHIAGNLVGLIASNGVLSSDASLKASHFVQLCSQRNIPIVFLQHIVDDAYKKHLLQQDESADINMIRSHAKLMSAVACADVPIVTILMGDSFGFESYMMGGRSFGSRFVFAWPTSRVSITCPDTLAQYIMQTEEKDGKKLVEKMEGKYSATFAASNAWNDGLILPQHTRKTIAKCLEIFKQSHLNIDRRKAVMRM